MRPDMSVTDIAACILKNRGKAVHFKELITEVMRVKSISQDNPGRLIAQMHTEINLDSRFIHQGNGEWGLREWTNKGKVVKIRPESSAAPARGRKGLRDDEEDEEDIFEAEEEEEYTEEESEDDAETDRDDDYEDEE